MECLSIICLACILVAIFWRIVLRSKTFMPEIHNRHVLITGCDSGFGKALAVHLDKIGVKVYAGCQKTNTLSTLATHASTRLVPILMDVADAESVKYATKVVNEDLGDKALWALVNNAGIPGMAGPIEFLNKQSFQSVLDVNLLGVIDVTLAFLPLIKRGREGRIINMSSMFGRFAIASGGYFVSKHAVEAFSDGLSFDLAPYGITIHTINPGFFKTNLVNKKLVEADVQTMWEQADKSVQKQFGEDFIEHAKRHKLRQFEAGSKNIQEVVNAYTDAILSRSPKNRYKVGWNKISHFLSILPFPWFMKAVTYLRKKNKTLPPQPILMN